MNWGWEGISKFLMSACLVMLSIVPATIPANAAEKHAQESAPSFTDQDLERYLRPSERKKPLEPVLPRDNSDSGKDGKPATIGPPDAKRYEIPYTAYEGTARRIIIPVTFNGTVTRPMLLDTGATGMHISASLAENLGLFEGSEGKLVVPTAGIGGTIPAILTVIDTISVEGLEDHFIPTKITGDEFSEAFDGIIGMDFMSGSSIHIDTRKHMVVFEKLPPSDETPGGHDEQWWRNTYREFSSKRSEWAALRDRLYQERDPSRIGTSVKKMKGRRMVTERITVGEWRRIADSQFEQADKLMRKLDGYATTFSVPMEWREY